MAKSSLRQQAGDTWDLLECYGAWARDTRTVKGYGTGHEGLSEQLDDDTALLVVEAFFWLRDDNAEIEQVMRLYFVGEKKTKKLGDGLSFDYYVRLNFTELNDKFRKGERWAGNMVCSGVDRLRGYLANNLKKRLSTVR